MNDILREAEAIAPFLTDFRHDLHEHPELCMEEKRTTARIAEELDKLGVPYTLFDPSGLMCEISGGEGRAIVLRADIDALPIQETTGLEYASREDGKMHSCGHDTHAAMLLGAVRLLSRSSG